MAQSKLRPNVAAKTGYQSVPSNRNRQANSYEQCGPNSGFSIHTEFSNGRDISRRIHHECNRVGGRRVELPELAPTNDSPP
jgi:hypothetical protein